MKRRYVLIEKRDKGLGGWLATVEVEGVRYTVAMSRGRAVRIPYKPRGQNRGYQWVASVYGPNGEHWSDREPGSLGINGILEDAGVLFNTRHARLKPGGCDWVAGRKYEPMCDECSARFDGRVVDGFVVEPADTEEAWYRED